MRKLRIILGTVFFSLLIFFMCALIVKYPEQVKMVLALTLFFGMLVGAGFVISHAIFKEKDG